MLAFSQVLLLHIDAQADVAATAGAKAVLDVVQVAGDQGEQVGGFRMGIVPGGPVPALPGVLARNQVAVAEQHRVARAIGLNRDGEHRHDIGPVRVKADLAKPMGLALGAEHAVGLVQSLQRGIVLGSDARTALELERRRHRFDFQPLFCQLIVAGFQRAAVYGQRQQFQFLPVQLQRRTGGAVSTALELQP